MQIDCFRAKLVFVIAIIGAIATIGTLTLLIITRTMPKIRTKSYAAQEDQS